MGRKEIARVYGIAPTAVSDHWVPGGAGSAVGPTLRQDPAVEADQALHGPVRGGGQYVGPSGPVRRPDLQLGVGARVSPGPGEVELE